MFDIYNNRYPRLKRVKFSKIAIFYNFFILSSGSSPAQNLSSTPIVKFAKLYA